MSSPILPNGNTWSLRPFRGSPDLKLAPRAIEARPANRQEQTVQEGANRLQDPAALVPDAAAILDEEMAAGMRAAYDARPPGSGSWNAQGRSGRGTPNEWLRDLHNLVDALGNVLPRAQDYLAKAQEQAAGAGLGQQYDQYESVPVLRPRAPVRAGEHARVSMKLNNDDANPAQVELFCSDLFSALGVRILQRQVRLTPERLKLAPDACAEIAVDIVVPAGSRPSAYCGLLLASGLSYLCAVIMIEVV
jgi:hypothetical protein